MLALYFETIAIEIWLFRGTKVSFMLLKSVQERETYEECCDAFTIGESDCICY